MRGSHTTPSHLAEIANTNRHHRGLRGRGDKDERRPSLEAKMASAAPMAAPWRTAPGKLGERGPTASSPMTPLQSPLGRPPPQAREHPGHVAAVPYAGLAAALASGVTADAVRAALVELRDDGLSPGKPQLDENQFSGTLPG